MNRSCRGPLERGLVSGHCKRRNVRAVHFFAYSRKSLDARKYDVSEYINHYKLNGITY